MSEEQQEQQTYKPEYHKYKVVLYVDARTTQEFTVKLKRMEQIAEEREHP